ncbi:hypothetical protein LZF95_26115, partial [Algoriphagus sp. AGSA1]|uniref:hypothetical protein n=1 Tax=Algoriphagus sp. AGSA1 TaxID=2907213 RepID=UPI001F1B5FBF
CQLKAIKDHNTRRKKKALGNISPVQFRTLLKKDKISTNYNLKPKPRIPEQPRKRNEIKIQIIT